MSKPLHRQLQERDPTLLVPATHGDGGRPTARRPWRLLQLAAVGLLAAGWLLVVAGRPLGWALIAAAAMVETFEWFRGRFAERAARARGGE